MKALLTILFLMFTLIGYSANYITKQTGLFSDVNTWYGGIVPSLEGDTIWNSNGITLIYNINNEFAPWGGFTNSGTLFFSNNIPFVFSLKNLNFINDTSLGRIVVGTTDNPYSFSPTNTPQGIFITSNCLFNVPGNNRVELNGDTSHYLFTRTSYNANNGQTSICVSNIPANCVSNDVLWIASTNIGSSGNLYVISSIITNSLYPNSNVINFKQTFGFETNYWRNQSRFTNKLAGAKVVGLPISFINVPIVFFNGKTIQDRFFSGSTTSGGNSLSGFRFMHGTVGSYGGFLSYFRNCIIKYAVQDAGFFLDDTYATSVTDSTFLGDTVLYNLSSTNFFTNCVQYTSSGYGWSIGSGAATDYNSLYNCWAVNSGLFVGPSSSYWTLDNCTAYNTVSNSFGNLPSSATFARINNATIINGPGGLAGGQKRWTANGVNLINCTGTGLLYSDCANCTACNITQIGSSNILVINGSSISIFGSDKIGANTASVNKNVYTPGVIVNNVQWVYSDGNTLLTTNVYKHTVTNILGGMVGSVHIFSVPPYTARTIQVACQQINNVSYLISYDGGNYTIPKTPAQISIPADNTGIWVKNDLTYNNTNNYEMQSTLWVLASTTNATYGLSTITINKDTRTTYQ